MTKFIEMITSHLTNWGLVWFCLIFWGSIFNAILLNVITFEVSKSFYLFGYSSGFLLGLFAKYKNWGWVN